MAEEVYSWNMETMVGVVESSEWDGSREKFDHT
jgi:hypothetical protein